MKARARPSGIDERRSPGKDSGASSNIYQHGQRRAFAVRRSAAALRLPDLTDGLPAGPKTLVVEVGPRFTAWLTGPSRLVVPLLATLSLRWQYGTDGWAFSRKYVDDVLALADREGHPIQLRSVER